MEKNCLKGGVQKYTFRSGWIQNGQGFSVVSHRVKQHFYLELYQCLFNHFKHNSEHVASMKGHFIQRKYCPNFSLIQTNPRSLLTTCVTLTESSLPLLTLLNFNTSINKYKYQIKDNEDHHCFNLCF